MVLTSKYSWIPLILTGFNISNFRTIQDHYSCLVLQPFTIGFFKRVSFRCDCSKYWRATVYGTLIGFCLTSHVIVENLNKRITGGWLRVGCLINAEIKFE